jgi:hypothetical protein
VCLCAETFLLLRLILTHREKLLVVRQAKLVGDEEAEAEVGAMREKYRGGIAPQLLAAFGLPRRLQHRDQCGSTWLNALGVANSMKRDKWLIYGCAKSS